MDGREAPGKFSLLYIQFPVLGFEIPVPRIFFQYQDWNPGTRDFFYWRVWSLFGDLFFFNYFFGKKFIKKNCHQKVTKLFSKNLLKSRYPGFSRMTPLPKDTSKGFRTQKLAVLGGGGVCCSRFKWIKITIIGWDRMTSILDLKKINSKKLQLFSIFAIFRQKSC